MLIIGYFIAKNIILSKVENYVSNLPEHIQLQYKSIDLDLLGGDFKIEAPLLTIKGKTTEKINTQIELETIIFEGVSYWNYWKNQASNRVTENRATENRATEYYYYYY